MTGNHHATAQCYRQILPIAVLSLAFGCAHKSLRPLPAVDASAENSYMDLQPGGSLRILVPLLRSGTTRLTTLPQDTAGNTIVLSAANLIGYQISHYAIQRRRGARVQLTFTSATITKDGKTAAKTAAPVLPFQLPSKSRHIRLIYLVRSSRTDHNMAILAAKQFNDLSQFTGTLKASPEACGRDPEVSCTWVPEGVAVTPE